MINRSHAARENYRRCQHQQCLHSGLDTVTSVKYQKYFPPTWPTCIDFFAC